MTTKNYVMTELTVLPVSDLEKIIRSVTKEEILNALETHRSMRKKEKEYLTIKEVARKYAITPKTVYNLIDKGVLVKRKLGGRTLLRVSEVEQAMIKIQKK